MSASGNTAKLGATLSNIQTAQIGPSLFGIEPTMHKWGTLFFKKTLFEKPQYQKQEQ